MFPLLGDFVAENDLSSMKTSQIGILETWKQNFLTCLKIFQKNFRGFGMHLLKKEECNIFPLVCKNN